MLRASKRVSAGSPARLRNTVRVEVRHDAEQTVKERFNRRTVSLRILKGIFDLSPNTVIAVQDTGDPLAFEVSFFEMRSCLDFLEQWRLKEGEDMLRGLRVIPCFQRGFVPLIVRMFNPFVPNEDVELFLARRCEAVRGGT